MVVVFVILNLFCYHVQRGAALIGVCVYVSDDEDDDDDGMSASAQIQRRMNVVTEGSSGY